MLDWWDLSKVDSGGYLAKNGAPGAPKWNIPEGLTHSRLDSIESSFPQSTGMLNSFKYMRIIVTGLYMYTQTRQIYPSHMGSERPLPSITASAVLPNSFAVLSSKIQVTIADIGLPFRGLFRSFGAFVGGRTWWIWWTYPLVVKRSNGKSHI